MTGWKTGLFLFHPLLGFGSKLGSGLHFDRCRSWLGCVCCCVAAARNAEGQIRRDLTNNRNGFPWSRKREVQKYANLVDESRCDEQLAVVLPIQHALLSRLFPLVDTPLLRRQSRPSTRVFDTAAKA